MVTFVKSDRIRSSMSRKDNVHPQQPHKPIIATLILPSRAADSAGSGGVAGHFVRCDFVGHGAPESSEGFSARSRTDSTSYLRRPIGTS